VLRRADTVVVGISRDSTWSHKAWKQAKGIKHEPARPIPSSR
jgi:alkyl hydroperoxide reductase subunit AhpC